MQVYFFNYWTVIRLLKDLVFRIGLKTVLQILDTC